MSEFTCETDEAGVALLTLRRPERLNALTWDLIEALSDRLASLGADPAVRVIILTGEGRGFCSGLDLGQGDSAGSVGSTVDVYRRQQQVASLAIAIQELTKPVIAAVNGPAAGGGLALALAADVRLCTPDARFNVAFIRIGLSGCDVGVSWFLPRIVGLGKASEMMLTGAQVGAEEAERIGLANRVVPAEELLDAAAGMAREMASNSPFGLAMTKEVLARNAGDASLRSAIELENRTQVLATRTDDMAEALAAFKDRRQPGFKGT